MKRITRNRLFAQAWIGMMVLGMAWMQEANALELDWSGQFWAEFNYIHNYAMDGSDQGSAYDRTRGTAGGYYIPGGGNQDATFQSLFLRLRPKVIVNDNIYIKSEWWVGDPVFGIFGNAVPYSTDQRQFYSNQSRGSLITAQRVWGEFVSDIGTFQVGRVPLHWGLGVVWNSGDNLWDRYMSTGDAIRWIAKFGSFSFIPSFIVNSAGNTIAGTCVVGATANGICSPGIGSGGVTDLSLILKYENTEEEFEIGANLIRRVGGGGQDPGAGLQTIPQTTPAAANQPPAVSVFSGNAGSINLLTYDLFVKKKLDRFSLAAEVPIVTGGGYQSVAAAAEVGYKASDVLDFSLKGGYAPGQPSSTNPTLGTLNAFFFNPNYHIGMILFNYQLANFAGPQTLNNSSLSPTQLASPYNNPIVNATYLAFSTQIKPWEKWSFKPALVYATAPQTALNGQYFLNTLSKTVQQNNTGKDQGSSLGWELDLGITFQWDEYFTFGLDTGLFLPGSYFAFSNTAQENALSPVFATSLRVGVNF